jgi:hypothetical protein
MSLLALLALVTTAQPKPIPPPVPPRADMQVGAFYFPGWARADRWYCMLANPKVMHPLLGYYREGDPEVADWHIQWAASHGVGFFAFDYYTHNGSQMLESALDAFLRSRFVDRVGFCLNWCNHAPASTMTAEHLAEFADLVIPKYLTHPSYVRIGGKPLVIILSGYSFVKTLGVEGARRAFADFDARCRAAGLPGVHLVSCEGEILGGSAATDTLDAGVRSFCLYNYPYIGTDMIGPGRFLEASYADMMDKGEGLWKHWKAITGGRFWPTVMPGWDRRPWLRDNDILRTGSTPELFRQALVRARDHVNGDRIVMIEAWNEWGEGSVLEPSVEHRFAYLDAVRSVFCPGARPCEHIVPADLGRKTPAFDLRLPSMPAWRFDLDLQGWAGTGIADLRADHGAIVFRTTSNDPQITAPANYIGCSEFGGVRLRMKATGPAGGPATTQGQLFWSTVDHAMREDTSVGFEVKLDGRWHVYDLALQGLTKWSGTADGLRLDPADMPGVEIALDEIAYMSATAQGQPALSAKDGVAAKRKGGTRA